MLGDSLKLADLHDRDVEFLESSIDKQGDGRMCLIEYFLLVSKTEE